MYLFDTDHITVLERGAEGAKKLLARLANVPKNRIAVTIVSYEEQTRG